MRTRDWGFKRWLFTIIAGIVFSSTSLVFLFDSRFINRVQWHLLRFLFRTTGHVSSLLWLAVPALILGLFLIFWGFYRLLGSMISDLGIPGSWPKRLYKTRHGRRGPKIVVVGGGTGLASLLRGLKEHTTNLSAIVTVADDGGSSGRLREEMGILPPGDVRNCLLALADAEPLLNKLFQHRFTGEEGALAGHNFGNLFLARHERCNRRFSHGNQGVQQGPCGTGPGATLDTAGGISGSRIYRFHHHPRGAQNSPARQTDQEGFFSPKRCRASARGAGGNCRG